MTTTRPTFFAESAAISSTTSGSVQDKASLTFTPNANKDYFLFWMASITGSTSTDDTNCLFINSTTSTTLGSVNIEAQDVLNWHNVGAIAKESFGASPASQTYKIQYDCETASTTTAYIRDARILALEADSLDQYTAQDSTTSTTSSTLQDKTTLTFTPGTTGDYIFIASAELKSNSSTAFFEVELDIDGTVYDLMSQAPQDSANYRTWTALVKLNLTAASHTIKIRYRSPDNTTSVSIRNARILGLRADTFADVQYAEQRTRQTTTNINTSPVSNLSLSFTPAAAKYVTIGNVLFDGNNAANHAYSRITDVPVVLVEAHAELRAANTGSPYAQQPFLFADILDYAAANRALRLEHRASNPNTTPDTVGTDEAAIAVLEVGSRSVQSASSTTESTTTNTSYQDKATLTFTPDASSDYLFIWSALINLSITTAAMQARLYNSTSTTALGTSDSRMRDVLNYHHVGGIAKETIGGSPVSTTYKIQYAAAAASTAAIREARIVALKLDAADGYAESTAESTTTSSTQQDKATLTFTPATTGDYFAIFSAEVSGGTGIAIETALDVDGTDYSVLQTLCDNSADYRTVWGMVKVNLSNASHTLKLQYRSVDNASTVKIKNARIVALRSSTFTNAYYAEQRTRQTYAQGKDFEYANVVSLAQDTNAGNHLVLATSYLDSSTTARQVYTRFKDGVIFPEVIGEEEPNSTSNSMQNFGFYLSDMPGKAIGLKIEAFSNDGTTTVGQDEIALVAIQTETLSANGTASVTGSSSTSGIGDTGAPTVGSVPTGTSTTGSIGALAFDQSVAATGVESTTAVGSTAEPVVVDAFTGVESTGSPGTTIADGTASTIPTGVEASCAVGTLVATGDAVTSISGVESAGGVGTVTALLTAVALPTGVESTSGVGVAVPAVASAVVGVESTGASGTVTTTLTATALPTTVSSTCAAGTMTAEAEANKILPSDLSSLHIWLDAQDSNSITKDGSALVSLWADKSSANSDAVESTTIRKPKYIASAIQNRPALQFFHDGVNATGLAIADSVQLDYTQMHMFIVATRITDTGGTETLAGKLSYSSPSNQKEFRALISGGDTYQVSGSSNGTTEGTNTASVSGAVATNVPIIFDVSYNGSVLTARRSDTGASSSSTSFTMFAGTSPFFIGTRDNYAEAFRGYIGEVLWFDQALSTAEAQGIRKYLAGQWGFEAAPIGVNSTTGVGTVIDVLPVDVTGNQSTTALGDIISQLTAVPTGVEAVGSVGTTTQTGTAATEPTGVESATSIGTAIDVVSLTTTGVESVGSPGTATGTGQQLAIGSAVGVESVGTVNTTVTTGTATELLTGVESISTANIVIPEVSKALVSIASFCYTNSATATGTALSLPTTALGTGSIGTITTSGTALTSATAVEGVGEVNTVVASSITYTSTTGVEGTGGVSIPGIAQQLMLAGLESVGSTDIVTALADGFVPVTGVYGTTAVGTVGIPLTTIGITGAEGLGEVGEAMGYFIGGVRGVESVLAIGTATSTVLYPNYENFYKLPIDTRIYEM